MPVRQHCQLTPHEPLSALFSCSVEPDILLFLLFGLLSRSPCHCGGSFQYHSADLTRRTLALLWSIMLPAHLCTRCRDWTAQMSVYKCAHLHSCKRRQDLCVRSYLWLKTSCWRPRNTGWRKLEWAQEQRAEQTRVQDFKWKLFQTRVPSAFTLESES